jgi:hypothetical protein
MCRLPARRQGVTSAAMMTITTAYITRVRRANFFTVGEFFRAHSWNANKSSRVSS